MFFTTFMSFMSAFHPMAARTVLLLLAVFVAWPAPGPGDLRAARQAWTFAAQIAALSKPAGYSIPTT